MKKMDMPDIVGGLAVFLMGLFYLVYSLYSYRIGAANRMGPGYYPAALGIIAMGVAALIVLAGLRRGGGWPRVAWRPALWVFGSIVTFIVALTWFGLVPAVFATVVTGATADRQSKPLATAVLAVLVSVGAWLIFSVGLGMTVSAIKWPF